MARPPDDSTNRLDRRTLLGVAGVAAGAALVGACKEEDPFRDRPPVPGEPDVPTGEAKWVPSACGQCPAGCAIRVRVTDGRANHIAGNPESPVNGRGIGPKGHAGLQMLYHPDRIRQPLKRDGPRGSGRWKPIGWEQAIAEVADALRKARAHPEGLVVLDGDPRGTMRALWDRFLVAYGSPNHVDHRAVTDGGKVLAMTHMHGVAELPAYDWAKSRYVIGFGASLFESWCQTIHFTRGAARARTGTPGHRTKLVLVSPRYSVTAAKADEWVPIEPATYGALALGIAHVLVRDGLHDKDFVRDHTFGFEGWTDAGGRAHRGFRDLLLADYAPANVAAITGVPAAVIERLAREMSENRPAVSFADGGAAAATNGLGTAMAIHALNALLGNLERPGGLIVQRTAPLAAFPPVETDEAARAGHAAPRLDGAGGGACPFGSSNILGVPDAILAGAPYPVHTLVLYKSNPFYSKPGGRRWIEAVGRVPVVVSFSPLPDESALWADFVLPDHTYLERWDVVDPVPAVGFPSIALRQPVVTPLHRTMSSGDALVLLARAVGGPVAAAFPWKDYHEVVRHRLRGVVAAPGASSGAKRLADLEAELRTKGSWSIAAPAFEDWKGAFRTPSGKFEFWSQSIAAALEAAFPEPGRLEAELDRRGVRTRGDDLCLPHWEPPRFAGAAGEFPFVLVAYRGIDYAEGGARHLSILRELPVQGTRAWQDRVEINPADAERLGAHADEPVWVESPAGRLRLRLVPSPAIRPGTLGLPLGHGSWPPAPGQRDQAGGYALLAAATDPLAGIFALQGTRARIRKEGA